MSYVVMQVNQGEYAPGYYEPDSHTPTWHDKLRGTFEQAAAWCSYLNGGQHPKVYEDWTK